MLVCRSFYFILSHNSRLILHHQHLSVLSAISVCMILVLRSLLYLPPAPPQPYISRSLYRNRSFLRIPLAARPRFSSLRSLRFVLLHSANAKGMHPDPSKFTCISTFEELYSLVHFLSTIWNTEENWILFFVCFFLF